MERKIGEIFTLPDGRRVRVDPSYENCDNCFFKGSECIEIRGVRGYCQRFTRSDAQDIIFTDITNEQPAVPSSAPQVDMDKLTEAFNAEIIEAARDAFVYRFWDYPNTRLAEIMNVSEATVRRIRKKRLQKNRTQD